jgi:hypothetical protein
MRRQRKRRDIRRSAAKIFQFLFKPSISLTPSRKRVLIRSGQDPLYFVVRNEVGAIREVTMMNARSWNEFAFAIATIALLCQSAIANDGRPSRDTLTSMGLGGLFVMSDDDALMVRGQGFQSSARAFGNSLATINTKNGSAHSENAYIADGKHFAAGANKSFAGAVFKKSSGKGGHSKPGHGSKWGSKPWGGKPRGGHTSIKSVKVFAGGHSWSVAF